MLASIPAVSCTQHSDKIQPLSDGAALPADQEALIKAAVTRNPMGRLPARKRSQRPQCFCCPTRLRS